MRGLFISLEGGDGSGKSTQLPLVAAELRAMGKDVVTTREPGGTELGVQLRQSLLHAGEVRPRAEVLLFAADRAQHVADVIQPALEKGQVVITDRFTDASIAYQSQRPGIHAEEVAMINDWATSGLKPDLTIFLSCNVANKRLGESGRELDRIERHLLEHADDVDAAYRELIQREPERWRIVDGAGDIPFVTAQILAEIRQKLEES